VDAALEGKSGLMTAIEHGSYALAPIPDPALGPRKVQLHTMYDTEHYRPNYANKLGLPVFLNRSDR
jgi:6-phosphofructokinase 1